MHRAPPYQAYIFCFGSLSFQLLAAPNFLTIDVTSGRLAVVPTRTMEVGNYQIVIAVSDGVSTTSAQFSMQVVPSQSFVSEDNKPSEIVFLAPTAQTVFTGSQNVVRWVTSDTENIASLKLEFSKNGEDFRTLQNFANVNRPVHEGEVNWDVTNLAEGKYQLRLTVFDSKGQLTEKLSEQIIIGKTTTESVSGAPLIINLTPADGSSLSTRKPLISGGFAASAGSKIDTTRVSILLNSKDIINSCLVTEIKFECGVSDELTSGKHQLKLLVADTEGRQSTTEIVFGIDISEVVPTSEPTPNAISLPAGTLLFVTIICITTLILVVIPWILYLLWRRKPKKRIEPMQPWTPQVFTPVTAVPPQSSQPTVNIIYQPQEVSEVSGEKFEVPQTTNIQPQTTNQAPTWLQEKPVVPTSAGPQPVAQYGVFGYGQKEGE